MKESSKTATFRINSSLLERLEKEAELKEVSLNTLVNQILRLHADWYCMAASSGFISVRRKFVTTLLEKFPDGDLEQLAEYMAKIDSRDFIFLLGNGYTPTTALEVLENWLKACGYIYTHTLKESRHSYVIQHQMGKKWSIFLTNFFQTIAGDLGLEKIDYEILDNSFSLVVDVEKHRTSSALTRMGPVKSMS